MILYYTYDHDVDTIVQYFKKKQLQSKLKEDGESAVVQNKTLI